MDERGLLDTSVVIAAAEGAEMELPDRAAISVVTLCELHHGVLRAGGREQSRRIAVLAATERSFEVMPVDSRVAPHYARLMAASQAGRAGRAPTADVLIAATAISHALPLYTRDADFERLEVPALRLV